MKERPIGVTILAVLAGIVAVLSAIHALQFLGILPFFLGGVNLHATNLWYALMWALMVWIYVWLVRMLWNVDPQGWLFLVIISMFELIMAGFNLLQPGVTFSDLSVTFLLNGLILIYCMLPSTRAAFGTPAAKKM